MVRLWRAALLVSSVTACGLTVGGVTSSSGDASTPPSPTATGDPPVFIDSGRDPAPVFVPDAGGCLRPGRPKTYEEEVIVDAPSTWLRLDDMSGPTATNIGAGGFGATYSTTGIVFGRPGATCGGSAIALDGAGGRVSFGAARAFPDGQPFSIEVWAQRGAGTNDDVVRRVFAFGPPAGGRPFFSLQTQNTGNETLFQRIGPAPANESYAKGFVVGEGVWRHIVATVTATQISLYLDGALAQSSPAKTFGTVPGGELVLGDLASPIFYKWKGLLDELAIYEVALSASRVKAHYDAGRP